MMTDLSPFETAADSRPPAAQTIRLPDPFRLSDGSQLADGRMAFQTWGRLSASRTNAVLIMSGFSASCHAASHPDDPRPGWWERMIGPGKPIDTDAFFVICPSNLGGCFGSTGPASIDPRTGRRYRLTFPAVRIEDVAEAAVEVVRALGIPQLACVIGTSMGGMSALSLLARHPGIARTHINISGASRAASFAIAVRSLQRQAILSDPQFSGGAYGHGSDVRVGMSLARMLGMLSYRAIDEWQAKFGRQRIDVPPAHDTNPSGFTSEFAIEGYLRHQADRFIGHYDPNAYLYLSRAIDRFDLSEMTGGDLDLALSQLVLERALVLGVTTDLLFPLWQQEEIAEGLRRGNTRVDLHRVDSPQGHDAFLTDFDAFGPPIERFLATVRGKRTVVRAA